MSDEYNEKAYQEMKAAYFLQLENMQPDDRASEEMKDAFYNAVQDFADGFL